MLDKIAKDQRFITLCKKLTSNKDLHQDLWQDVLLKLCTKKSTLDEVFGKDGEQGVSNYVYRTIYITYIRFKTKYSYLADNEGVWKEYKEYLKQDNTRYLAIKATSELHKKMLESENKEAAKVLWAVANSNTHQVSKDLNKSFYQVKKIIDPIKKQITRKLDE